MIQRFIAIDPSSTNTGWAVFADENLIAWGTIKTEKMEYAERFNFIIHELDKLAARFAFTGVAIEDIKFAWASKNRPRNIAGLQVVFRVIKDWSVGRRLAFNPYNVARWKNNIVGNVHASKEQTMENVCLRLDNLPRTLNEHEYDAVAIGINHAVMLKRLDEIRQDPGTVVDNMSTEELLAMAKLGMEALVDEATGYEKVRPPDFLKKQIKKYRGKKNV
jgi:crossover junction endodeoxyribonuclease RuvC